ncbi:MAG TPA: hypothetical protein VGH32_12435, partial [Pirellulales bacterium]
PLLTLDRQLSPHVEPVKQYLERRGVSVTISPVDYEFQKAADRAGNRMMRICGMPLIGRAAGNAGNLTE